MANARRTALSAPLPASPPSEFRIWPFGEIRTTKGTFLFDRAAARAVLDAYATYGNRLTIDYEHKAVDPARRAGDGKSAGSFVLELRADGLYAVDVRWTPPAYAALSNKEWLYFSPYFSAEEDSGRILELINLALTNIPATTHMTPLVAAHRSALAMDEDETTTASVTTDDSGSAPPEEEESEKAAARRAARERVSQLRAALAEAEEACAALADDEPGGAASTEEDETLSETEEEEPRAAAARTSAAAAPKATTGASRIVAAAVEATGKTDPAEIVGALTALGRTRSMNVSLSKRVADLERKLQKAEVEELVSRAVKTGKLTPAEREWALSYGMESIAKLRGYLDVTPQRAVVAASGVGEAREPRSRSGNGAPVALSDAERRICANTGIDPVKFAELKNRPIRYSEG